MEAAGPAGHPRRRDPRRRARVPLRDVLLRHRLHRGLTAPTRVEIDEARARWREIAGEDAGLGPIAAFHDERLGSLEGRPTPDVAVGLSADEAAAAVRDGVALLQAGRLSLDSDEFGEELRRVARNLAETAEPETPAHQAALVLAERDVDAGELLGALVEDRPRLERDAARLGADPDAVARIIEVALQPFLWEAAAQLEALTDVDRWDRGYCPVCGAWPALAELVGPERKRVLRCVRCGVGWSWLVLLCPYCGNDDHRTLRVLQDATQGERVDVCERCHGYVKAITSYAPVSAARLVAEDARTVELDVAAANAGYTRPGDVDARTAGVPRLVREGRITPPGPVG